MRVIVTRVQPQASAWVAQLCAQGHDALALPLIEVRRLADPHKVQAAWQAWPTYAAAMFVSSHAVDFFFKENKTLAHDYSRLFAIKTRAWSTGPGTARALLAQGVPPALVDTPCAQSGQFDSEALWQVVAPQVKPGDKVLIVRGNSLSAQGVSLADGVDGVGRDWLAQRLMQAGAEVNFVVAYERGAPLWSAPQRTLAQAAAREGSVWLFSSTEALDHLDGLMPETDWCGARALATHPRIAAAARALGFGLVKASKPTLEAVLASIESLA